MQILDFKYLKEDSAPEYKARMTVSHDDGSPSWEVLVFRAPNGELESTIITEDGQEFFSSFKGINDQYIKDVRVACIGEYTFRRNADHSYVG